MTIRIAAAASISAQPDVPERDAGESEDAVESAGAEDEAMDIAAQYKVYIHAFANGWLGQIPRIGQSPARSAVFTVAEFRWASI